MEQGNAYRRQPQGRRLRPLEHDGALHVIGSLLCPSDPGAGERGTASANNNYAGVHNDVEAPIDATNTGVLYLNSRVRYEDIPDGSSFTVFLGEHSQDARDRG
ncbi:MAG: DUF1559 domain-containing protein [Isosphaeraceae bacterium]